MQVAEFERTYTLKGVGDPEYYLGANIFHTKEFNEWSMEPFDWILSSQTYARAICWKSLNYLWVMEDPSIVLRNRKLLWTRNITLS